MIDANTLLQISLGLIALWVFWYRFWKDYVIDKFRQDVFGLRNEIFLSTAKGQSPFGFDSHEYRKTIEVLNFSIRCAENFTIVRIVLMSLIKCAVAPGRKFESIDEGNQPITSTTSEASREYIKAIQSRHGHYTIRYFATVSPTLVIVVGAALALALIIFVPLGLYDRLKKLWRDLCISVGEISELSASNEQSHLVQN